MLALDSLFVRRERERVEVEKRTPGLPLFPFFLAALSRRPTMLSLRTPAPARATVAAPTTRRSVTARAAGAINPDIQKDEPKV